MVVSCLASPPDAKEPTYHTFIQNGAKTTVDTVDARPLSLNGDAFGHHHGSHRPAFMRRSVHQHDETENVFGEYEDDEDDDEEDEEEESNEHSDTLDGEYTCKYNPCGDEIMSVASAVAVAAAAKKAAGTATA